MSLRDQIRKGSTEVLILTLLAERPMYGYEMVQELEQRSNGYFEMKEGLLYPTLHRMQQSGWLSSRWQTVDGRRRKYYALTSQGREVLGEQAAEWTTFFKELQTFLQAKGLWTK
jgi:PadR family transcriptional regulator, regulatory protein PadR